MDQRHRKFQILFETNAPGIRSFALRRVPSDEADEIVAETFLVAWRRLESVPIDPTGWLYGVARLVIQNHRRTIGRQQAVARRIESNPHHPNNQCWTTEFVDARLEVMAALARLSVGDQEVLLLAYWDFANAKTAAYAMNCSPSAFRVRLSRARKRLRQELKRVESGNRLEPIAREAR